jgi:putative Flp pilus-assembly TadE/G-like protein
MRRFWQRLGDSSGSVLILVAGIIFFVAAFTVLAVDISKLLVTRTQLQNAADAGALAGAEMFMQTPVPDRSVIEARARDLANANRAYVNSDRPMDQITDITATAFTDAANESTYGIVKCVTRSVVSQYFTALPGYSKVNNYASANPNKFGNVAAVAAARAGPVCSVQCLKPWTIPDRWDDFSQPNATGWSGNNVFDGEKYTDSNNNLYYDNGEPFVDGSSAYTKTKGAAGPMDGQYSSEYYHPINTGYVAWKDLGLELTLKYGNPSGVSVNSQFTPIDLPIPGSGSTGADRYRENIANCNPTPYGPGDTLTTENGDMKGPTGQGMRDLINQDPGAYWDDGCQCVKSQFGDESPRIVFIPLYDPRVPLASGKKDVVVSKIAAFFIESATVNADVKGRFVRVAAPGGQICPPGVNSGQFVFTLSLIDPALANK